MTWSTESKPKSKVYDTSKQSSRPQNITTTAKSKKTRPAGCKEMIFEIPGSLHGNQLATVSPRRAPTSEEAFEFEPVPICHTLCARRCWTGESSPAYTPTSLEKTPGPEQAPLPAYKLSTPVGEAGPALSTIVLPECWGCGLGPILRSGVIGVVVPSDWSGGGVLGECSMCIDSSSPID